MTQYRLRLLLALATLISVLVVRADDLPRSGFLGVQVGAVTADQAKQLGIQSGVKVLALVEGGSAKASGIQAGDVIMKLDAEPATSPEAFADFARRLHAGDMAAISLLRAGKPQVVRMEVKPRPYESAPDADVTYASISVNGPRRRVIVTRPRTPGKHPAILYITGIGCFSQESLDRSTPEAKLLYGLTSAGFVTMRVEKSGMGDSEGTPCASVDMTTELDGYLAALRALKQYESVDPQNVYILGLSIGGIEAPIVARQEPVKGVIVVNTVAKPFLEYLIETRRRQGLLRHTAYDELDRRLRTNELCNHRLLIEKQPLESLLKDQPQCREFVEYPASTVYMQQWAAIDPAAQWKQVSAPVLIVYGLSDFVATTADHSYLASMLDSFHPGQATLKAIVGMDHYLTRAESMEASMNRSAATPGEFDPEVLDAIVAWLKLSSRA